MKIEKINQNQTNFKAIKCVRCEGLYRKNFDLFRDITQALKENLVADYFFKKYDVAIILNADEKATNLVESSLRIIFDNPFKNKFDSMIDASKNIFNQTLVLGHGYSESLEKSLKKSTADLKAYLDGSDAAKSKAFRVSLKTTEDTLKKDIARLKINSRRLIK